MLNKLDDSLHELNQVNLPFLSEIIRQICIYFHQKLASPLADGRFVRIEDQIFESIDSYKPLRVTKADIGANHIGVFLLDWSKALGVEFDEDELHAVE